MPCSSGQALASGDGDFLLTDWSAAALLLFTLGMPDSAPQQERTQFAQLIVREQIMVRVPMRLRPPDPRIEWKESRGPKCVAASTIIGAALVGQESVDFVMRDRSRVRAELENSCPALDYYRGFYITPNADGKVCADRDIIRSRMGGQCGIERFRALKPVPRG